MLYYMSTGSDFAASLLLPCLALQLQQNALRDLPPRSCHPRSESSFSGGSWLEIYTQHVWAASAARDLLGISSHYGLPVKASSLLARAVPVCGQMFSRVVQ